MKVLVTGGSGFCGVHLMESLLEKGCKVRNLDMANINEPRIEKDIEFIKSDIRDKAVAEKAARGVDIVFHTAAVLPVSRSKKKVFRDINIGGTKNVLEASLKNGVRRVVFISSSAPYGVPIEIPITEGTGFNPVGEYGRSKIEAERLCGAYRQKGLDVVILRPRTIGGSGRLGIFQILYSRIAEGRKIYIIGRGDNLFQLLSVSDLTRACLLTMEKPCANEDINIGAGSFATVKEDLEALISYADTRSSVVPVSAWAAKSALAALDRMNLSPLVSWHYLTADKPFYFDIAKAKSVLGFNPEISNAEMLKDGYDWYLAGRDAIDRDFGITHRKSIRQRLLRILN